MSDRPTLSPQALAFLVEMFGENTKASGPWSVARLVVEIHDFARAELARQTAGKAGG
jgi:hypothetical protein